MSLPVRTCILVLVYLIVNDGVSSRNNEHLGRSRYRQVYSYPRDWDIDWKQWARQQNLQNGDPVHDFDYTKSLSKRELSLPRPAHSAHKKTQTLLVTRQNGSADIPYVGSTVRVTPHKGPSHQLYKEATRNSVTDRPRRREHRKHHQLRQSDSVQDQWQYSQDETSSPHPKKHPCVRCPVDRELLAAKGSDHVFMDTPPIIPCHPRSPVKKVKSEVVVGPQPGTKMSEGSHKMVLRLYRHKRNLTTCVVRYNVIVRKCPELELSPVVKADCTLGKAWGSNCSFTCAPGYLLEGESWSECSDDLEWTGVQPQCVQTNELAEEESLQSDILVDMSDVDMSPRLDENDCIIPSYCLNGGKCQTILGELTCSCQSGYKGLRCENKDIRF